MIDRQATCAHSGEGAADNEMKAFPRQALALTLRSTGRLRRLVRGPDAYAHFDPEDFTDLKDASATSARAYVEQLLVVAADDAKNVLLLATVSIATVVFLIRDLGAAVAGLGFFWEAIALAAVGLLLLSGGLL